MSTFDFAFRPASYWDPTDPVTAILANITGEHRRRMVRDFVTGHAPEYLGSIDPGLLEDVLEESARARLGRLHPSWLGGEYLPAYLPGEVEIARLVLDSVTQDVISVRARRRRRGTRIHYRVVDEYETEHEPYTCRPRSSRRPLSLGDLIRLVDGAWFPELNEDGRSLPDALRGGPEMGDPERLAHFVRVESPFYPELEAYYSRQAEEWLERKRAERADEEPDGEAADADE